MLKIFYKTKKGYLLAPNRTNFTGSVKDYSDVKISSVRAWYRLSRQ